MIQVTTHDRRGFLKRVAVGAGGLGALMLARRVDAPSEKTVVSDYVLLTAVGSDPTVADGAVWYRLDLGRLRFMPPSLVPKSLAFTDDAPGAHTHSHDTELTGVSADDHHPQSHALGGADHTGTISDAQHGARTLALAHLFTALDFTGSNLTSLATRRHTDLTNLGLDEHTQYVLRSILTTKGDLFTRDASAISRLGVGTNGDVLTVDSVQALGVKWAAPSGGGTAREETVAAWEVASVKTNIGAAFVDIYTETNSQGKALRVDFTGKTQYAAGVWWDKIGTGTQNVRCVDVDNVANVLFDIVVVSGRNTTGPTALPGFATGIKYLKLQAKSTTAADDPVFRNANVLLK